MPDNLFFKSKITGKSLVGGKWRYAWKEQVTSGITGTDADPLGYRRGTTSQNYAVELNDIEVKPNVIVWMRERGGLTGQMIYEFLAPDESAGGTNSGGNVTPATNCGWVAGLTSSDCVEVKVLGALGRCACSNTTSGTSFLLSSSNGTSWTYTPSGTPTCGSCASGSPESWVITLLGGDGDFAALNGTYTLTRNASLPCQWDDGSTVGLAVSGTSWTLTATSGSTSVSWTASAANCCSTLTLTPGATSGTGTPPSASTVKSASPCPGNLLICGNNYSVTFSKGDDCGGPCLTLGSLQTSGVSYKSVREFCGANYAVFSVGDPAVCTGTTVCGGPASNVIRLQVRWALCNWDGPGWYCVRDCGTTDDCVATELLDGDQYRMDIEICKGPYEDEEEATYECSPIVAVSCDGIAGEPINGTVAKQFRFTVSGATDTEAGCVVGNCSNLLNGEITLTFVRPGTGGGYPSNFNQCVWESIEDAPSTCNNNSKWYVMRTYLAGGPSRTIAVFITINDDAVAWSVTGAVADAWDGKSPITLTDFSNSSEECTGMNTTLTLTPVL